MTFREELNAFCDGFGDVADLHRAADELAGDRRGAEAAVAAINAALAEGRLRAELGGVLRRRIQGAHPELTVRKDSVATRSPDITIVSSNLRRRRSDVDKTEDGHRRLADNPAHATHRQWKAGKSHEVPQPSAAGRSAGLPPAEIDRRKKPAAGRTTRRIGPGSTIKNRFVIESELGRGGMGIVFEARDLRKEEALNDDPYVAIKILNEEFLKHPKSLIALEREARKAQALAHPNIVTVYDFDRDGDIVFMTMELLRGKSLYELIHGAPDRGIEPGKAMPIIYDMASGLAYAHDRGMVHCDFKPGNVFVTDDGRVKILDFGIARAARHTSSRRDDKTVFNVDELGALTPSYASLEMLDGETPEPADDVYALSVTAYQLLSGKHPFDRRTAREACDAGLAPTPIRTISRREWKALSHGLALHRKHRTPSAGAFLARLRTRSGITKPALTVAVALLLVSLLLGYRVFQDPGPPIPWADLPAAARVEFQERIESGRAWLDNDPPWFGGAFEDFDAAYTIHPRNPEAVDGLREVAAAFLELGRQPMDAAEKRRLLDDISAVSRNEFLADHGRLQRLRESLAEELD